MIANEGWVKVYRPLLENEHYKSCPHTRGLILHCILRANFRDGKLALRGSNQTIIVPRGSFVTGRDALYSELYPHPKRGDPSPISLWRRLQILGSAGFVSLKNLNNRASMVTLCNYSTYQDSKNESEQLVNNRRTTGEQPVNTIEEGKKEKKNKKDTSAETVSDEYRVFFPPRLNTPECHQAVQEWIDYCWEQHKKNYKSSKTVGAFIKTMAMKYPDQFCHDITFSMGRGWEGVHSDKAFTPKQDMPACKEDHANFDFANDRRVKPWLGLPEYDGMVTLRRPGNVKSN